MEEIIARYFKRKYGLTRLSLPLFSERVRLQDGTIESTRPATLGFCVVHIMDIDDDLDALLRRYGGHLRHLHYFYVDPERPPTQFFISFCF